MCIRIILHAASEINLRLNTQWNLDRIELSTAFRIKVDTYNAFSCMYWSVK